MKKSDKMGARSFGWGRQVARWIGLWFLLGCATSPHLNRGDKLMDALLFDQALEEYNQALEEQPTNSKVQDRVSKAHKAMADTADQHGQVYLQDKDFPAALREFKKATQYALAEAAYAQHLKQAIEAYLSVGKDALKKKKFLEAISVFKKILGVSPESGGADKGLKEAEGQWADLLYREATDFQFRGLYGNALLSLLQLKQLKNNFKDVDTLEIAAREQLGNQARFGFHVRAAKNNHKWPKLNQDLAALASKLNLGKCPTAKLTDEQNARLSVVLDLKQVAFQESKQSSTSDREIQIGVRLADNPAHVETKAKIAQQEKQITAFQERVFEANREVEESGKAFNDAGPEAEQSTEQRMKVAGKAVEDRNQQLLGEEKKLAEARAELAKIPAQLSEPVIRKVTLPIAEVTRTASAVAQVEVEAEGESISFHEDIAASASTNDTTYEAIRKLQIKADPLRFPKKDSALIQEALEQIAEKVGEQLQKICLKWHNDILTRAGKANAAAATDAVEDYVLFLVSTTGVPPTVVVDFLKKVKGFTDLKSLKTSSPPAPSRARP